LQAHGHSRKETAAIIGVAPETISVWKRHPQWRLELERWRELAEAPLDARMGERPRMVRQREVDSLKDGFRAWETQDSAIPTDEPDS
jgi:uncharacterized protein YjcR